MITKDINTEYKGQLRLRFGWSVLVSLRSFATASLVMSVLAVGLLVPNRAQAQAPPGPIAPVPSQDPQPSRSTRRPPAAKLAQPTVPPRTTLAGPWRFNRNESDDPLQIVRTAEHSSRNDNPANSPGGNYPGGGYPGGGYPGGGYPGSPNGSPFPRQGGPSGRRSGSDIEDNAKMQPLLHPSNTLNFNLKDPEVDVTDDRLNQLVVYTDGRQLQKKSYNNREEIAGHWSGTELVSDEKSPLGGKMSRTFELSQDGRKFYETLHIDDGHSKTPIVIRYVYDASASDAPASEAPDPDRPVLKRNSDDSADSQQ